MTASTPFVLLTTECGETISLSIAMFLAKGVSALCFKRAAGAQWACHACSSCSFLTLRGMTQFSILHPRSAPPRFPLALANRDRVGNISYIATSIQSAPSSTPRMWISSCANRNGRAAAVHDLQQVECKAKLRDGFCLCF